ncbi:hypothetical protein Tco_1394745 [Tanacetum coccineum]
MCFPFKQKRHNLSQQGLEFLFSPLLEEYYNPTHGQAEENNNDQAPNASIQEDEFINPFCTRIQEIEQVRVNSNPSMPVQTRRQLATDPEMCMFALTVSIVEPKNIKEAMADSAWIEAMQDELHQFDRLKEEGVDFEESFALHLLLDVEAEEVMMLSPRKGFDGSRSSRKSLPSKESFVWIKASPKSLAKYALEILKKHNMDNCHSIGTPLATKPKLDVDLSGEPVDQSDYRSKIGSLMYLTSSRPDLVQAVCYCARYQARPTQKHLKYLKGTINMGLWYPKDSGFELTAFSRNAYQAGCLDTRKSTSGGIQFLGDKLVSWMSKKQNCTAMSSAEAEYVALSASCAQLIMCGGMARLQRKFELRGRFCFIQGDDYISTSGEALAL